MNKKYKDMEIMYSLKENNIIICYSQFAIAGKYKIYKKNEFNKYEYVDSKDSISIALTYVNMIFAG